MRNWALLTGLMALILATSAEPAFADACKDILVNGTMTTNTSSVQSTRRRVESLESYNRVLSAEGFDTSGSATLPLEVPIDVSGSFSYNQSTTTTASVKSLLSNFESTKADFYLASGDPIIVDAWRGCMMRSSPGMVGSFTNQDAVNTSLAVSFFPFPGNRNYSIQIDRVDFDQSKLRPTSPALPSCLTVGRKIWVGDTCVGRFLLKEYYESFLVGIEGHVVMSDGTEGPPVSLSAFLPPRIAISQVETGRARHFEVGGQVINGVQYTFDLPDRVTSDQVLFINVELSDEEVARGWMIGNTANVTVSSSSNLPGWSNGDSSGTPKCDVDVVDRTPRSARFKVVWRNTTYYRGTCTVNLDTPIKRFAASPAS